MAENGFIYFPEDTGTVASIIELIQRNGLECNTTELPSIGLAVIDKDLGVPIGYIGAHTKYKDFAHIDLLVIDEPHRKKGLGTLLIKEMCQLLDEMGYVSFSADVHMDNAEAITLYIELGAKLRSVFTLTMNPGEVVKNINQLTNQTL